MFKLSTLDGSDAQGTIHYPFLLHVADAFHSLTAHQRRLGFTSFCVDGYALNACYETECLFPRKYSPLELKIF